jgi:hypothetical protein
MNQELSLPTDFARNLKFAWLIFPKRAAFLAHSIVRILQEKE